MWFDSWSVVARTLLVGAAAYAALVLLLRVTGKRTLSKLNAFDLVVTVALGSTLATILLNADVALAEGATALALLIAAQLVVTWTYVRLPRLRSLVTAHPTLLLRDGVTDAAAMRRVRVTEVELAQAVRSAGVGGMDQVAAVVLESDGTLSVIPASQRGDESALREVFELEERDRRT